MTADRPSTLPAAPQDPSGQMQRRIYLDNAATSFPKPPAVAQAMAHYARDLGAPGRGAYAEAAQTKRLIDVCRERICRAINGREPRNVVFTLNTTDAMNLAIWGLIGHRLRATQGAVHVITSDLDHNSALRPLNALVDWCAQTGRITQTRVPVDPISGLLDPAEFKRAIRPETALVVTLHASNVTGAIQPVAEIGRICRERGVPFLLDAAQSLGHVPVDVEAMGVDLLAFPGHKGLLGPTGTGGLYIAPGMERRLDPVRQGGTGWRSEQERMPEFLPDKFEPGSHNAIGIIGLSEGVAWLAERGHAAVRAHEEALMAEMLGGLTGANAPAGLRLLGPTEIAHRVGVFSFIHEAIPASELAARLEREHGVLGRAGLHCAPAAHRAMGTGAGGAMRLSVGPFTTVEEVRAAVRAVGEVCAAAPV
jgi:cysteine desulfurase / selenocysteine lyase